MGEQHAIAVGDWDLRSIDLDTIFAAEEVGDTAMDAGARASVKFSEHFPGWELYRRVVSGIALNDRKLEAWSISMAEMLAGAEKASGRRWISAAIRAKPGWVAQAGRDALDFAIYGRYAEGLHERAERFDVAHKTYQRVRDPVAKAMWIGLETYKAILHAEYWNVRRDEKYPGA